MSVTPLSTVNKLYVHCTVLCLCTAQTLYIAFKNEIAHWLRNGLCADVLKISSLEILDQSVLQCY